MAISITQSTLNPTITQTSLGDAIKNALLTRRGTLVDDYILSGTRQIIVSYTFDATKVFDKLLLQVQISSTLVLQQQVMTAWNTSTKAATNASGFTGAIAINATTECNFFVADVSDECLLVLIRSGSVYFLTGYLRPLTINNIDTNIYCPGLCFNGASGKLYLSPANNIYANANYDSINTNRMSIARLDGQRDVLASFPIFSQTNRGIFGIVSQNLGLVCSGGLNPWDLVQTSGGNYRLISTGDCGLSFKE